MGDEGKVSHSKRSKDEIQRHSFFIHVLLRSAADSNSWSIHGPVIVTQSFLKRDFG